MKKIFILLMMILANVVVFLVDEDIDAYFNGTLVFFNSNNQVVLQWVINNINITTKICGGIFFQKYAILFNLLI